MTFNGCFYLILYYYKGSRKSSCHPCCVLDVKYEPRVDGRLENIKRGSYFPRIGDSVRILRGEGKPHVFFKANRSVFNPHRQSYKSGYKDRYFGLILSVLLSY